MEYARKWDTIVEFRAKTAQRFASLRQRRGKGQKGVLGSRALQTFPFCLAIRLSLRTRNYENGSAAKVFGFHLPREVLNFVAISGAKRKRRRVPGNLGFRIGKALRWNSPRAEGTLQIANRKCISFLRMSERKQMQRASKTFDWRQQTEFGAPQSCPLPVFPFSSHFSV